MVSQWTLDIDGEGGMPYDDSDEESILRYAGRLSGRTLRGLTGCGEMVIGGARTKGSFGQAVERDFFRIPNNNRSEPDFGKVGMELKVAPMRRMGRGFVSKERMVLGMIDFDEVPERGFDTFLEKGSHILIVFYLWTEDTDIYEYEVLKVVDWRPTDEELRMIREDWEVIEGYIMRGEAHLLSERHTRYLAANTKGAGHGGDMRSQPFSDIPAKQRSLSFKPSFMTSLYLTHPDVNEMFVEGPSEGLGTLFADGWSEGITFGELVRSRFDRFVGRTCEGIEDMVGHRPNRGSKQYYRSLTMAMLGMPGKIRVKEFEEADITIKTIRVRPDGRPKESMSFPAFRYEDLVRQTWEDSDLLSQLDRQFLLVVFGFNTSDPSKEDKGDLTFLGAFLWYVPDADMEVIRGVWEDTRRKVLAEDFDHFVKASDGRIAHVRPHGRDSRDTYPYKGRGHTKRGFWLNDAYVRGVIAENLTAPVRRGRPRDDTSPLRGP